MEQETTETENTTSNDVVIEDPKAVLDALNRAKADAKKYREEAEKLQKEIENTNTKASDYQKNLIREKLIKKISSEGVKDGDRILKFIDVDKIGLDDDLEIIGVEDQIEQLKNDLPEIFDPKLRVGGKADTAVKASVSTQYSASEMQALKVLGKL